MYHPFVPNPCPNGLEIPFSVHCLTIKHTKKNKQKRVVLLAGLCMLVSPDVRGKGVANKKKLFINY